MKTSKTPPPIRGTYFTFLFMLLVVTGTSAQIGRVGINTLTPQAMLHVKDSSVLFSAVSPLPLVPGNPPISGAGTRMMWFPDKAVFRAGIVTGGNWDKSNLGEAS